MIFACGRKVCTSKAPLSSAMLTAGRRAAGLLEQLIMGRAKHKLGQCGGVDVDRRCRRVVQHRIDEHIVARGILLRVNWNDNFRSRSSRVGGSVRSGPSQRVCYQQTSDQQSPDRLAAGGKQGCGSFRVLLACSRNRGLPSEEQHRRRPRAPPAHPPTKIHPSGGSTPAAAAASRHAAGAIQRRRAAPNCVISAAIASATPIDQPCTAAGR